MKIEPRTLKGFRDFLPNEARKRAYVIEKLKSVFESYGFEPLETPTLEYAEILTGKYGDEGDKLMYRFKDNGDRDVALRYDQTVPLARAVAQYGDKLPMPFKRYQIQNVWRAENTQKGRFREFLQCDIDTVGSSNMNSSSEILCVISDSFKELGVEVIIKINDRSIFEGINPVYFPIIDKLNKLSEEGLDEELESKGLDKIDAREIFKKVTRMSATPLIVDTISNFQKKGYSAYQLEFDPELIRGLDYYTGLIIEVVSKSNSKSLSLGGGGSYDELIGMFTDKKIPAVGFAFGFDRIIELMDELGLFPKELYTTKSLVLNLPNREDNAFELATKLRKQGINTEVYLDSDVEKSKQFAYAEKKNIPFTVVCNDDNTYTLGWKENGQVKKEENISFEKLLELLRK